MKKLSCLFLCLAVAASGLARGRHTEPMAMDISGPPRLVIADDSVTVILRVKVPDEMTRNREVHHKFHIHLVSERNSDDQVYVSTIHMRGKKTNPGQRTRVTPLRGDRKRPVEGILPGPQTAPRACRFVCEGGHSRLDESPGQGAGLRQTGKFAEDRYTAPRICLRAFASRL